MAIGYDDAASASGESDGPARGYGVSRQGELLELPEPGPRTVTVAGVHDPVARVLLDSPVPHLDRTFDYLVPAAMAQQALPGTRVMVRFGEQEMRGWIWERGSTTTHIGRLSALRRVVSDLPVLPEGSRRLIEAVASRSCGTRSDVIRLAVPARHATTEKAERDKAPLDLPTWEPPSSSEPSWRPYDGGEEYLNSEKYEFRPRDYDAEPNLNGLLAKLNSIRAAHPALQQMRGTKVLETSSDKVFAFAKRDGWDRVVTVVSLDPDEGVDAEVRVDLGWLGLDPGRGIRVHDELTGQDFDWGAVDYVRLWPAQPAHVLSVSPVQL